MRFGNEMFGPLFFCLFLFSRGVFEDVPMLDDCHLMVFRWDGLDDGIKTSATWDWDWDWDWDRDGAGS